MANYLKDNVDNRYNIVSSSIGFHNWCNRIYNSLSNNLPVILNIKVDSFFKVADLLIYK